MLRSFSFHTYELAKQVLVLLLFPYLPLDAQSPSNDFFESHIRPVLVEHCYECHSSQAKELSGGLRLDSKRGILAGGDSGPAFDKANVDQSLLLKALRYEGLKMPPTHQLPLATALAFGTWLRMGAPDPREEEPAPKPPVTIDWEQAKSFWSFRPISSLPVPQRDTVDIQNPIDVFIASEYDKLGIVPNNPVNRSVWLRRVYVDLLGIPPSLEEVRAFDIDQDSESYEQVVDRLLAHPAYGRRWGRHWLDLARYADSNGADENHRYPVAWRYRDYVINAMNEDTPYDRFVVEQLAGDLLTANSEAEQRRFITATGFLVIGPKMLAEQDKPKMVADLVDEQLDTVGKSLLGLTLGCARCHDHKFDPILASDYYALAGIFHSTKSMDHLQFVSQWNERILPNEEESTRIAIYERQREDAKHKYKALENDLRWQSVSTQLHLLLSTMHWQLESSPSTQSPVSSPKSMAIWIERFQRSDLNKSDMLYAWQRLSQVSKDQFSSFAAKLWKELASVDSKSSDWNTRLRAVRPPESQWELITLYSGLITRALQELSFADRTTDGKFANPDMQRLYNQLVAKSEYFSEFDKFVDSLTPTNKEVYAQQKAHFESLQKAVPAAARAMAVQDAAEVKLVSIHVRGNHLQMKGDPLERAVPRVFQDSLKPTPLTQSKHASGRLEFAKWIVDERNPLSARIIVNRIWQHHFGTGIVASSSNFGYRGDRPTHPELLDWLASEFIRQGWSMKWLHRQIVLCYTYRLSSQTNPEMAAIDPGNQWLWRQNKRRLDAESLRDTLLSIADAFDQSAAGESQNLQTVKHSQFPGINSLGSLRPTVYADINRAALNDYLASFDYVEPGVTVERRSRTIVPHQSLYLMNHSLPQEVGKRIAERLFAESSSNVGRLSIATCLIFGRKPSMEEISFVLDYLKGRDDSVEDWILLCRSLLLTNEFLYVD